ncbi:cyclic nucleotide-binding/CBS domain-containing protein [Methanogenium cariaci]|uniref:CBS domain-containing protein n=1 Tax=Methanogenium cariaci TaxID=2197 RepID=UPI00155DB7AC|nr:CBS domain-containing protein [Methanogenium cariaci]
MPPEDHHHPISIASCVQITTLMTRDLVSVPPRVRLSLRLRPGWQNAGLGVVLSWTTGCSGGIITEQDLTRKVVAVGGNPGGEIPVSAIMSSPVVSLGTGATVGEAADLMIQYNIRRIVVEDEGRTVGIVTARDVLGFASDMNNILQDLSGMYGTLMFLDSDMQVLWVNKQSKDTDVTGGSKPVHCYELLHSSTRPCHGCPLTLAGTTPGKTVLTSEIIDNDHRIWQVQCHPVSWGGGGACPRGGDRVGH